MFVKVIVTNWDEKGESIVKYGKLQAGYMGATFDPQPQRAILTFEFDTAENAAAADKAITTFAQGQGYLLG